VPARHTERRDLPDSLLLWRSLLHFLGGLGIVLMFLVVLRPWA
jgi:Trk-type K+ transport system membrane component